MTNVYCTFAELQADVPDSPLSTTTDAGFETAITGMITDASRLIDNEVGRWSGFFYPSTDLETRYFDGSGETEIRIDEMVSIDSVSVAESGGTGAGDYTALVENEDFYTSPYNKLPIKKLVIDWNGSKHVWSRYRRAVKVTGVFGWSTTPPDEIKRACKIQALRWFMRAKQGYQDAGANVEIGQMTYVKELDPDIKRLLMHYRAELVA